MRYIILSTLTACILVGCATQKNSIPTAANSALEQAIKSELYSLEPWEQPEKRDNSLHGYKILGKTHLDQTETQEAAVEITKTVKNWKGFLAACFDPRQALRVNLSGDIFDYLICYQCHRLYVFKNEENIASIGASGSPLVLNAILKSHGIPISKTGN